MRSSFTGYSPDSIIVFAGPPGFDQAIGGVISCSEISYSSVFRSSKVIEVKSHPGTFIVGFLFLLVPVPLDAQSSGVTFNHLSERDGMAGREVHCILQDSRGFLWFGTENGLNRYDGYGFTVYKHEPGNAASIVDAKIQSLWEDKQGDLWVGT